MKIAITGGHLTTAVAVIDEIRRTYPAWDIVFIGRARALEGSTTPAEEQRTIESLGIPFRSITAGRLTRAVSFKTVLSVLKFPVGIVQAFLILLEARPDVILSFGGYVALPVVVAGRLLGIAVFTHEQTLVAGLANRVIARLSEKIFVTFPGMVGSFPRGKAVYTGLPLRKGIFQPPDSPSFRISKTSDPLLYITGGMTGSLTLNRIAYRVLRELLSKYVIVHQVGRYSMDEAEKIYEALPRKMQERYIIVPYLDLPDYAWVLHNASLVIGRSGANTVLELAAIGKPALFVPLPWASGGEQEANAKWLAAAGSAHVIHQTALTPSVLVTRINGMMRALARYQKSASAFARSVKKDGAARIVQEIPTP